ncbi:hypothetical protein RchiOBHm_Chr7g0216071 [Rosa chinensis]|uniref:Uncharacterized protein n=1 Tax=Rosa chinensis TaxID=74649 RepID=A0A2P6PBM7_ROSCH|nr:hypothetical protein RchiOBHm_Chr7g0216071 [Rosa chinensis]
MLYGVNGTIEKFNDEHLHSSVVFSLIVDSIRLCLCWMQVPHSPSNLVTHEWRIPMS